MLTEENNKMKITAIGELYGNIITVTVEDLKILYNGEENLLLEVHMEKCIENELAVGGTYYPTKDEMLCYYNVLSNNFFNKLISIEVEGELETIPNDGEVY